MSRRKVLNIFIGLIFVGMIAAAIILKNGDSVQTNLRIQITGVGGKLARQELEIVCGGKRIPKDRVAENSRRCSIIQKQNLKPGNFQCKQITPNTATAAISGTISGSRVDGRYSLGPCPEGFKHWEIIQQLISSSGNAAHNTSLYIIAPAEPPVGKSLQRLRQSRQVLPSSPCITALAINPTASCTIQTYEQPPLDTAAISANWAELASLLGAPASRVKAFLLEPRRVPLPSSFPGYQPNQQVPNRLPDFN